MQRTRINTIITSSQIKIKESLNNPWRKISLSLISLFFGVFIGQALSTTAGQAGMWDVTSSALILLFTEGVSRYVYRANSSNTYFRATILNLFKIGITFTLFLDAFKVGS